MNSRAACGSATCPPNRCIPAGSSLQPQQDHHQALMPASQPPCPAFCAAQCSPLMAVPPTHLNANTKFPTAGSPPPCPAFHAAPGRAASCGKRQRSRPPARTPPLQVDKRWPAGMVSSGRPKSAESSSNRSSHGSVSAKQCQPRLAGRAELQHTPLPAHLASASCACD